MRLLSTDEITAQHARCPLWTLEGNALVRTFRLADFSAVFGLMTRVALLAEQYQHHPDWSGGYQWVTLRWTTHDAGGLTELDFTLAAAVDALI